MARTPKAETASKVAGRRVEKGRVLRATGRAVISGGTLGLVASTIAGSPSGAGTAVATMVAGAKGSVAGKNQIARGKALDYLVARGQGKTKPAMGSATTFERNYKSGPKAGTTETVRKK